MRIHDRIPAGASANADIFGRTPKRGDRVVNLEVDTAHRPPGLVVLTETTVVAAAKKLGYHVILESEHQLAATVVNDELDRLRKIEAKYLNIQEALANV